MCVCWKEVIHMCVCVLEGINTYVRVCVGRN